MPEFENKFDTQQENFDLDRLEQTFLKLVDFTVFCAGFTRILKINGRFKHFWSVSPWKE